jgi:hypothetical protein
MSNVRRLVSPDSFPYPLFHGTSTLFVDSIVQLGLGAHDPVKRFGAHECLRDLKAIADNALRDDEWWLGESALVTRMCAGSISAGGFSFRYGQVYLSASEVAAVRYACSNAQGSEFLSTCVALYERIAATSASLLNEVELKHRELLSLGAMRSSPVLVQVTDVPCMNLRSETGLPIAESLASMRELATIGPVPEVFEGHHFTLLAPIPPSAVQCYLVELSEPDPYLPKYSLRPYEAPAA